MKITKYPDCAGDIPTTDDELLLPPGTATRVGQAILDGLLSFDTPGQKPEKTLAQKLVGLPTLFARADCVVLDNGTVIPYEIEERPRGLGYICTAGVVRSSSITDHIGEITGNQARAVVLADDIHADRDDGMLFGLVHPLDLHTERGNRGPLISRMRPVRAKSELGELLGPTLQGSSISTVMREGDKMSRVRQGLATVVDGPEDLPPESMSFVLKPKQGTGAEDLLICLSALDKQILGIKSSHTRDGAKRLIESRLPGQLLIEPFIAPMQVRINNQPGHMILRIYALISGSPQGVKTATVIGGMAVTRPTLVVHGASDAAQTRVLVSEHITVSTKKK